MSDPFDSEEAKEAYKEALDAAFEASRHLTNFLHLALKGEPVTPSVAITAAVESAKDAAAAWSVFSLMSEPERESERPTLQ